MIIYNKYIPFKGFKAMAIFPFIFVRGENVSQKTINHEKIHFAQQKELFIIGFYILYLIFWIIFGYRNNPFEREAYKCDLNLSYLNRRVKFSWKNYIK
jgi:hypothetical protein